MLDWESDTLSRYQQFPDDNIQVASGNEGVFYTPDTSQNQEPPLAL